MHPGTVCIRDLKMCCSQELPKDDPRIIAWEQFKSTPEYENANKWAKSGPQYVEGSMWATFLAGYTAAKPHE